MSKALILGCLVTAVTTLSTQISSEGQGKLTGDALDRATRDDQYYYRRYGNNYPTAGGGGRGGEDPAPRQIPSPKYIPGSKYPSDGQWVKLEPIDYNQPKPPSYDSNSSPYNSYNAYPQQPSYPDSRPKFFNLDHRYSPSGHGGYPSGPSSSYPSYPSNPSHAYPSGPSVSGSGYPYNSGTWNSHHGISSYGWDKRPPDSLCGVCPVGGGMAGGAGGAGGAGILGGAVSPQRGEYRGNGYDNLSPEWTIRQMKHHGGSSYPHPGAPAYPHHPHSSRPQLDSSSSWNKYPSPTGTGAGADYDRGNAGESVRYPTGSWSSGSSYGGPSGTGGSSWGDKRPGTGAGPGPTYSSRPYDDRKGIYPVKSTPGTGYWDSHPPREIGWDPHDNRVGVVSGWIGGQKDSKPGGQGHGDYKGSYDDYDRKDRYPEPSRGFGGGGGYDVGRVTSGYVYVPNSVEARPRPPPSTWDTTTKSYSNGKQNPSWGSGYERDYASKWDYNAPMPNRGYDNPPPRGYDVPGAGGYDRPAYNNRPGGYDQRPPGHHARPDGWDTRPAGYDTRPPGGYNIRPGGFDMRPGVYDTRPGGYDTRPGGYDTRPGAYDTRPGAYDRRPDDYTRGHEAQHTTGCTTGCGRPADAIPGQGWQESGSSQDGYPSRRPDPAFPGSGPGDYDTSTRFQNDRIAAPLPTATRFNGHSGIGASTEYGYVYRGSYQQDRDQAPSTTVTSLPVSTTIVPSTTPPSE